MSQVKIIHVSQPVIRRNAKHDEREPPLIVRGKHKHIKLQYCHEADLCLDGEVVGRFVYSPDKPLSCGAKVYFISDKLEIVPRVWDEQEKKNEQ